jgi:hypothetical protein
MRNIKILLLISFVFSFFTEPIFALSKISHECEMKCCIEEMASMNDHCSSEMMSQSAIAQCQTFEACNTSIESYDSQNAIFVNKLDKTKFLINNQFELYNFYNLKNIVINANVQINSFSLSQRFTPLLC